MHDVKLLEGPLEQTVLCCPGWFLLCFPSVQAPYRQKLSHMSYTLPRRVTLACEETNTLTRKRMLISFYQLDC